MSNFIVRKVAVLGAGVMGAQIAAHCVNARVPVMLFDLPATEGNKNGIVLRAIENLKKLSPAPLNDADQAALIGVANYEDNLEELKDCDLIIEVIAECLDWKHALYNKVAPYIARNAIFASNTSGLSIAALSEGFDADLKARFCGVHFFNPPRYMHLVELIPTASTRPEILDQLERFLASTLGKGVIQDLGLNPSRVNPMGGAIALGDPLGATGAIRAATVVHALRRKNLKCGMVTMCVGTGMGAAGIFERV